VRFQANYKKQIHNMTMIQVTETHFDEKVQYSKIKSEKVKII